MPATYTQSRHDGSSSAITASATAVTNSTASMFDMSHMRKLPRNPICPAVPRDHRSQHKYAKVNRGLTFISAVD